MKLSMFQFTIRQMMIVAAIVAIVLALTETALRDDPLALIVVALIWVGVPILGPIGLGLLPPRVTGRLLVASCVVLLPISAYHFFRYATLVAPVADKFLMLGLLALGLILPFAIGHALSRDFHAWRASNSRQWKCSRPAAPHKSL
jgi:hypothetical protein